MSEKTHDKDFIYKHKNPYHDKLKEFDDFVMRDNECEKFKGEWNTKVFQNKQEIHVEIGSGYGEFMAEYCQQENNINFIGMDYRFKRSFTLAKKLNKLQLINIKYLRARGERIIHMFDQDEVNRLFYFFPDPWPKARHKKKRLFKQDFINQVIQVLKPGGQLWIKTDHDDYAEQIKQVIENNYEEFEISLSTFDLYKDYPEHFLCSFQTKFEKIFIKQKTPIKAFVLIKR